MLGEFDSVGLLLFGAAEAGCGSGSLEVDRFASSSVAGGVGTGAVGVLLTVGFRPAQPVIAKTDSNKNSEKKGRFRGHSFPCRTLKRSLSSDRFLEPPAVFLAILRPPPISRILLAGTPQSSFPFLAQHLPIQIASR